MTTTPIDFAVTLVRSAAAFVPGSDLVAAADRGVPSSGITVAAMRHPSDRLVRTKTGSS